MTPEQQRKMLECAAKACGFECGVYEHSGANSDQWFYVWNEDKKTSRWWNPLANALDTAEMCAKLEITCLWVSREKRVTCSAFSKQVSNVKALYKDHDNSRLKAWMYAATMVGACIGGYTE